MKKLLLALAAVVGLLLAPGCGFLGVPDGPIAARDTVRLLEDPMGFASGVVIAPGVVLTAQHVVAAVPNIRLGGQKTPGEVIAAGNGDPLDIALVRYPATEAACPCAPLAEYPAQVDEPVWVIGFPQNIAQLVTTGTVQATKDLIVREPPFGLPRNYGNRLILTAIIGPGNSGGGAFVYRGGRFELVGILVEGVGHISAAIPLEDIKRFLAEHQAKL